MSKISVTSSTVVPGASLTDEPFLEWAASILVPVLGFEEFHVLTSFFQHPSKAVKASVKAGK